MTTRKTSDRKFLRTKHVLQCEGEARKAALILLTAGMPIRQVERVTGLPYITCYRMANSGTGH